MSDDEYMLLRFHITARVKKSSIRNADLDAAMSDVGRHMVSSALPNEGVVVDMQFRNKQTFHKSACDHRSTPQEACPGCMSAAFDEMVP